MILFLDFDGVLHHENVTLKRCKSTSVRWLKDYERRYLTTTGNYVKGVNLFEHADRLATALEPFPDVRIVLSTSWREHFRPGSLLRFLPPALADRVIGQTPHCDKYGGVGSRLFEVLAYIEGNGLAGEPWIALDDQAQLFWDDTENPPDNLFILKGDEAFTEDMARALSERLQAETPDPWADPILRAAKNDYQEKCRADVRAGVVSEESMHLFSREMAGKVTIEYRDVDYE